MVTEIEGRVVGFIAMAGNEIGGLFLDPAFHGCGLGRAMVDKAVEQRGTLTVEVFKENTIGRAFYERYGFQFVEEFAHEASGQQVIRMMFTPS